MDETFVIRDATAADAHGVSRIYNHYIAHTTVTFEVDPVTAEEMSGRIQETRTAGLPFLVAAAGADIQGFAYASRWKGRCAYRYSAEVTVYVRENRNGRGLGAALYGSLLPRLRAQGLHALLGGIALPNAASVALHEKFGFVKVAHMREVGRKFDQWVDVGYWQLLL